MEYLLTAEEMAAADKYTSEQIGIPSLVLMERAALGVAEEIRADFPDPERHARCAVVAGKGNNGADALAVGRLLLDAGYEVRFFLAGMEPKGAGKEETRAAEKRELPNGKPNEKLDERAEDETGAKSKMTSSMVQQQILIQYGCRLDPFSTKDFEAYRPDIVVEGLFGTGLSREVGEPYRSAISEINRARDLYHSFVYAVDIPSGIDGTTGEVRGIAVQADVTVTFAYYKRGQFLYPGCGYCGRLVRKEIGITGRSFAKKPELFTYRTERPSDLLPSRDSSGNKGTFGKVLVIAGSRGVSGACTMCASAALRMGAGMVKIFTHEANRVILQETVPEAMVTTYDTSDRINCAETNPEALKDLLRNDMKWASVIAIGPGMGKTEISQYILETVLDHAEGKGIVIDADAIRLIAEQDLYEKLRGAGERNTVILTPHMAECAVLLKTSVRELQKNRFTEIKKFANLYRCTIIGKDARTLIASWESDAQYLNTSGNDGLSTAGSGDVLTGVTAGCLAQGMHGFEAACAASYIHGLAADQLTGEMDKRSIVATDLIKVLTMKKVSGSPDSL